MKFNIKLSNNAMYAEEGQINPLRWKVMFLDGEDLTDQTGWIKCKDFFNDSVAYFKTGQEFSIYSYQNKIKKNENGVFMLLRHVTAKPTFFKNLDMVNERLRHDFNVSVPYWDQPDSDVVIMIPNALWETTYRISMISMVIRLCNYGVEYPTWEYMWDSHAPVFHTEHSFSKDAIANALKMGFKVPAKFEKYWWYCGKNHNSDAEKKLDSYTIHNNGVSNWSMAMKDFA